MSDVNHRRCPKPLGTRVYMSGSPQSPPKSPKLHFIFLILGLLDYVEVFYSLGIIDADDLVFHYISDNLLLRLNLHTGFPDEICISCLFPHHFCQTHLACFIITENTPDLTRFLNPMRDLIEI